MLGNMIKFANIADVLGEDTRGLSIRQAAMTAVETLRVLASDLNVSKRLSEFGVKEEHIPELARGVMKVTRLLANNPRDLTLADAEAIYRSVL